MLFRFNGAPQFDLLGLCPACARGGGGRGLGAERAESPWTLMIPVGMLVAWVGGMFLLAKSRGQI